jgi:hypothetical protein
MPTEDKILKTITFPENCCKSILTSTKYNFNHVEGIVQQSNVLIKGIQFFCYPPINESKIEFRLENIKKLQIKKYEFKIYEKCVVTQSEISDQENVQIFQNCNNDVITVLEFTCQETLTDSVICKINL